MKSDEGQVNGHSGQLGVAISGDGRFVAFDSGASLVPEDTNSDTDVYVRDRLLGRVPHDYDVATSAPPEAVRSLFARTVPVGMQFGVVLVLLGEERFEVATFRADDAYVDGHVTFVAPRVSGQVARVLVEDNNRVRKGDLLVQLDREPFEVQLRIAQAAVDAAQSDLANAEAQARGLIGQARSMRFGLEHAIELVDNQVALLNAKLATLKEGARRVG